MAATTPEELEKLIHNAVAAVVNAHLSLKGAGGSVVVVKELTFSVDLLSRTATLVDVSASQQRPIAPSVTEATEEETVTDEDGTQEARRVVENSGTRTTEGTVTGVTP